MNKKIAVVKEIYRDLNKQDCNTVLTALEKSGWVITSFNTEMSEYGLYAHLYATKDDVKIYIFFNANGLKLVQTMN